MSAKILRLPTPRAIRQHTHYRPEPLNPARMARFDVRPDRRAIVMAWVNDAAKAAALIAIALPFLLIS